MKRCRQCGEEKPSEDFSQNKRSPDGFAPTCRTCTSEYARAWRQRNLADNQAKARARLAKLDPEHLKQRQAKADAKWREAHPEEARAKNKRGRDKLRETNPDYHREWYQRNAEKRRKDSRERMRALRKERPKLERERKQRYREKHTEEREQKKREAAAARKAKRLQVTTKRCTRCGETKPRSEFPPRKDSIIGMRSVCKPCWREVSRETTDRWREANPAAVRNANYRRIEQTKDPSPDTLVYIDVLMNDPCTYCDGAAKHIDHIVARNSGGVHDWSNLTSSCASCNPSKGTRPLLLWLISQVPES